jgi:hypothetical protein
VNRLNSASPKGVVRFYSPPPRGECVVREGGSCQAGACAGAASGGTAHGRARFDATDEKEMVQRMGSVEVELC